MRTEQFGIERNVVDGDILERTVARFRERRIVLPTFAQLAEPASIPGAIRGRARAGRGPTTPHPLNLFRVHWHNDVAPHRHRRGPDHLVLPPALTGSRRAIVVALGDRFPMIGAHKVLAAYACLAPRIVTGQFDPDAASGGLAVDRELLPRRGRDLAAHGLPGRRRPAGGDEPGAVRMARAWVANPYDIIRTPGTESNVKEIYDECDELAPTRTT